MLESKEYCDTWNGGTLLLGIYRENTFIFPGWGRGELSIKTISCLLSCQKVAVKPYFSICKVQCLGLSSGCFLLFSCQSFGNLLRKVLFCFVFALSSWNSNQKIKRETSEKGLDVRKYWNNAKIIRKHARIDSTVITKEQKKPAILKLKKNNPQVK